MMKDIRRFIILIFLTLFCADCNKDNSLDEVPYNPTPYILEIPPGFPYMRIPSDNPATVEGIQLGRKLFYDPAIDIGDKRACGQCHKLNNSFSSDTNSLPLINMTWNIEFLWKGKVEGYLEDIMLFEVEEFFQTDLNKLNHHSSYPGLFKKAFGTENISSKEIAYALAQFVRTLITCNSKWDRYLRGETVLTEAEEEGRAIYYSERGDCFHCHGTILFTDNSFHNNGLDSIPAAGRAEITGNQHDWGKFKTPTLRNIELTAPYMYDGRFKSLDEVIDFYCTKVKWSPTIDPLMKKVNQGGVHLNEMEKRNLISFIKTFTDTTFINNTDFSNPFSK